MGTRSTILLKKGNNEIQFYHHWDGYLPGVGRELYEWGEEIKNRIQERIKGYEEDIKYCEEKVKNGEENYKQSIENKKGEIEATKAYSKHEYYEKMLSKMIRNSGYEIEPTWINHGDIEYFYLIDCEEMKIYYENINYELSITASQLLKNHILEEVTDKNTYHKDMVRVWEKGDILVENKIILLTKAVIESREQVEIKDGEIIENYAGIKLKKIEESRYGNSTENIKELTRYLEEHKNLIGNEKKDEWVYKTILSICKQEGFTKDYCLRNFIKFYEIINNNYLSVEEVKKWFDNYRNEVEKGE